MSKSRNVVPNGARGWKVTGGLTTPSYPTQTKATAAARRALRREGGGEVSIHGRDGRVRAKDTVPKGRDAYPPKG